MVREREVDVRANAVPSLVGELHDHVAGVADAIGVVARPASHDIVALPPVKDVRTALAQEPVFARSAVEDVRAAFAEESVVTRSAADRVDPGSRANHVRSRRSGKHVVAATGRQVLES